MLTFDWNSKCLKKNTFLPELKWEGTFLLSAISLHYSVEHFKCSKGWTFQSTAWCQIYLSALPATVADNYQFLSSFYFFILEMPFVYSAYESGCQILQFTDSAAGGWKGSSSANNQFCGWDDFIQCFITGAVVMIFVHDDVFWKDSWKTGSAERSMFFLVFALLIL